MSGFLPVFRMRKKPGETPETPATPETESEKTLTEKTKVETKKKKPSCNVRLSAQENHLLEEYRLRFGPEFGVVSNAALFKALLENSRGTNPETLRIPLQKVLADDKRRSKS